MSSCRSEDTRLASGDVDVLIGAAILKPERLLFVGFSQPYETATLAVALPDHRRGEFDTWDDPHMPETLRLGAIHEDTAVRARRIIPHAEVILID